MHTDCDYIFLWGKNERVLTILFPMTYIKRVGKTPIPEATTLALESNVSHQDQEASIENEAQYWLLGEHASAVWAGHPPWLGRVSADPACETKTAHGSLFRITRNRERR